MLIFPLYYDLTNPHTFFNRHAIFATNTSALPVRDIASVTSRLDRFGGLHFFNPVPVMKLLEIIRIAETSNDTNNKMTEFGKAVGKSTVQAGVGLS